MKLLFAPAVIVLGLALAETTPAQTPAGEERTPEEWIEALRGEERERAIAALAQLGKPAGGPLARALEDADPELAWQIARTFRALGKQGAPVATKLVMQARDRKAPAHRRACAAASVGSLGQAAKSSAKALIDALEERSAPEVELHVALAMCELGDSAAEDLCDSLRHGDLRSRLWAVSILVQTRERHAPVNKALVKLAETLPLMTDREAYLLQPAAVRILERDRIEFTAPPDLADYLEAEFEMRHGRGGEEIILLRGGRLDDGLRTNPEAVRQLLFDELGLETKLPTAELALPESFPDWDGNGAFSVGELVRALALHLADVTIERTAALRAGTCATYADWSRSCAASLGLVVALQELLDPAFLEKSRYLNLFWTQFNGFRAPSDDTGF